MATIGILRRGAGDPTFRRDPDGTVWRGVRTPRARRRCGWRCRADLAHRRGDGVGAPVPSGSWRPVPAMLGADDDDTGFVAHHPQVAARGAPLPRLAGAAHRAASSRRWCPAILEQKVTGQEAFGSYRTLVRRYGAAGAR